MLYYTHPVYRPHGDVRGLMSETAFEFANWDVERIRLSIFYPPSANTSDSSQLWETVTGEQPSSIDSRPREGVTQTVGVIQGNEFRLITQSGRLDWMLQPIVVQDQQTPAIPTLKDAGNFLPVFRKSLEKSLETAGVVMRLAFAPALAKNVGSLAIGLGELSGYLPRLELQDMETADFIYRVNRRRRSFSVPHAEINRIAKWSMEEVGSVAFRVARSGRPDLIDTGTSFVRKLDLDLNTTPQSGAMSSDRIIGLFEELVILTEEIATKGDV